MEDNKKFGGIKLEEANLKIVLHDMEEIRKICLSFDKNYFTPDWIILSVALNHYKNHLKESMGKK